MKTPATKSEVQVNGKLLTDATVSIADQLEINLASLTGDDGAVLAVTAFIPVPPSGKTTFIPGTPYYRPVTP